MSREQLFTFFFFLVFGFLLYQIYLLFSGFLQAAAWAGILALVFYPAYQALVMRLRRPSLAAVVMTLVIYLMVVLPAFTLGSVAVQQSQRLYAILQEKVQSGEARQWLDSARGSPIAAFIRRALPGDVGERIDLTDLGLRGARSATEYLVGQIGDVARNVVSFIINFLLMLVILFFFFRDGPKLYLGLRDLIPMEAEHKDAIVSRFYETLSAVVQGMTITALAQGLLAGIGFWVLGVPFALLLALASALGSLIPLGGAALVWVPTAGYLFVQGFWGRGIALALWGTFVVSLADNVVKPLVIGSRTQIPTLFLFLGILGGLQVYGVLGVFLGPAVLATIVAVFRIYREEYALASPPPPPPLEPPRAGQTPAI